MIPKTHQTFQISRTGITIIIASVLLASLLIAATVGNIRREERLMQNFLLHEGTTLIRAFEAGARTSMMHHMRGDDPLATLVSETVKEPSVVYIKVVTESGRVMASAGLIPAKDTSPAVDKVLAVNEPITTLFSEGSRIFEVAAPFEPVVTGSRMSMMMGRWQRPGGKMGMEDPLDQTPKVIYLGLATSEFDQARQTDIKHAMLLGAILFLAGMGGFILLLVSQRKRVAESTLAEMELYTKNVIESMPAGLITLDTEGRVVSCNIRAEHITGKRFAELAGKRLADEMPSWSALTSDSSRLLDEPFECSHGGTTIPVRVSSSKLLGIDGSATGLVLIIRDVREIQEMEQKMERSRRLAALGGMATGIAHEIRNPLGTLRGFAQFFKSKFEPNTTEQDYAALMIDEIDRLNRSISELLQFAKPREPEMRDFPLNPLLTKAARLLDDDCRGSGIVLKLSLPAEGIKMYADPDLILQMSINLLKNSIEASGKGDTVTLSAESRNRYITIKIEDTGRGMNEEQQSRMFDPFYTTRKAGTGLGLAIVHQIAAQHHGKIEVDSEPGHGTGISLTFPVRPRGAADV